MPTLSQTLVTVTLCSGGEHITAFANRLNGDRIASKTQCDRDILTFAFDNYFDAVTFQTSLGAFSGFVAAAIAKS